MSRMAKKKRPCKPRSQKRKLAEDAMAKFPDKPKATIAKWLAAKYPMDFHSAENARTMIRHLTGSNGKISRKYNKEKPGERKPLVIPASDSSTQRPFKVPPGKYFFSGDWHIPYHDQKALSLAAEFAIDEGCDSIFINGDAIDFYQVSQWEKDPRKRCVKGEREMLHAVLDELGDHFDSKIYKIGNHEDRFTRRVWQSTPELAVLPEFELDEVLQVKPLGYKVVDSKQFCTAAGLNIWHGHELPRGLVAAVNPGRGIWLRTNTGGVCNHFHRTSQHTETVGTLKKKVFVCHSVGCLCDLTPDYAIVNRWNHGFAILEVTKDSYQFDNYIIENGKVFSQ